MKFLKTALTIALLYPVVWFAIFIWPDMKEDLFQDKCSMEYVTRKYESVKNKPQMAQMNKQVEKLVKDNNLFHLEKEDIRRSITIYGFLAKNNCTIPENLSEKFNAYVYGATGGDKTCGKNIFLDKAEKYYENLTANGETLEFFEKTFYDNAIQEMSGSSTKNAFDKKWKEKAFRKKTIIRSLQTTYREENGCKDAYAPMKEIMTTFMK